MGYYLLEMALSFRYKISTKYLFSTAIYHYITEEIKPDALCTMPDDFMPNIKQYIPQRLLSNPDYESLRVELSEEITKDYHFSMRKSIGT